MEYVKNYRDFITDREIKMYRYGWQPTQIITLDNSEVEANEDGQKIVPAGTLVDKDGKICKLQKSGITGEPVGITVDTKNVTYSNQPVAIYVRGHLKGPELNFTGDKYDDAMGTAVETALPEIKIYPRPPKQASEAV